MDARTLIAESRDLLQSEDDWDATRLWILGRKLAKAFAGEITKEPLQELSNAELNELLSLRAIVLSKLARLQPQDKIGAFVATTETLFTALTRRGVSLDCELLQHQAAMIEAQATIANHDPHVYQKAIAVLQVGD
jgi:hypothetical protein